MCTVHQNTCTNDHAFTNAVILVHTTQRHITLILLALVHTTGSYYTASYYYHHPGCIFSLSYLLLAHNENVVVLRKLVVTDLLLQRLG